MHFLYFFKKFVPFAYNTFSQKLYCFGSSSLNDLFLALVGCIVAIILMELVKVIHLFNNEKRVIKNV